MTIEDESIETVEDVADIFPGAINVANLLRTVAWGSLLVLAWLGGILGGSEGGAPGAAAGVVAGALIGVLTASGTFALAYILLLLNEIEQNTRVTASGNTLSD